MFSPRVIAIIMAFTSATLAAPQLEVKSVAGDNSTCWLGNIGEPCYGHGNGCTHEGAKASCYQSSHYTICALPDTGVDQMIFFDACYPPDTPPDANARNVAGRGTCRCLPGGESDCSLE